jgi:hypothetical protein
VLRGSAQIAEPLFFPGVTLKKPETPEQITGGGGRHILFMASGTIKNAARFAPGLDTKTDGGFIVAAPSLHKSGRRYEWELSSMPGEVPLAPWPSWLLKIIQSTYPARPDCPNPKGWELQLLKGVKKGRRNQCATMLAGFYLQKGLRPSEVFFLLMGWNNRNRPPLRESEIRHVVKSVAKIHKKDLGTQNNPTRRRRPTNRTNNVTY